MVETAPWCARFGGGSRSGGITRSYYPGAMAAAKKKPTILVPVWAWMLIGLLLMAISLPWVPHCWEKRSQLSRQLSRYERSNRGYGDVAKRLSLRFQDGAKRKRIGNTRMRLQRQRGTWDTFIGVALLVATIGGWLFFKPIVLWIAGGMRVIFDEDQQPPSQA